MTKEEYVEYFQACFQDILKIEDDFEVTRQTSKVLNGELLGFQSSNKEERQYVVGKALNSDAFIQICNRIEYILLNRNGEMNRVFGKDR